MEINKHKVFLSFKYEDVKYKDELIRLNNLFELFEDWHAGEGDIKSENMTDEQVRVILRDDFIKQSSVLVLLCGQEIRESKYVDWELSAAMTDYKNHPSTGILVIVLPTVPNNLVHNSTGEVKRIYESKHGSTKWVDSPKTFSDLDHKWRHLPIRIIDNFFKEDIKIDVINWSDLNLSNPEILDLENLKILIDEAYKNRKQKYDTSRPLKDRT